MTVRKNKILSLLCLMMLVSLLTGCSCEHQWQSATCLAPRTCTLCGTTEGKTRSHDWGSTACNAPAPCTVCGTMEGIELTHEWRDDCKICIHCGQDERPADDRFMDALSAGLTARYALEKEDRKAEVVTADDWAEYFDAEYEQIGSFAEEKFRDEELGAQAKRYVNSVAASRDAVVHFGTDQWADEYQNGIYLEQAAALFNISKIRPVTVEESAQKQLERFLTIGEIIDMVHPLFDQIMFFAVGEVKNETKYETTVHNTTSLDFEYFTFEVLLLDEQENVIATETATVKRWKAGERIRFNFTTDEVFHTMKVKYANWKIIQ